MVSCVLDDFLLVSLYVERLKLEYAGQTIGQSLEELEAGVIKERELEAQLADMDPDKVATADDKGAKKGKAPPKGGKAPDETIKEELE